MRVLLIKTSSMGDIIHMLPALTDAKAAIPELTVDWVVEESFTDIPPWHPAVNRVIPVALRKWRRGLLSPSTWAGWKEWRKQCQAESYDIVLDAQGLVKSAILTLFANGTRAGLDWHSARESIASLFYQRKSTVNFYQHAVVRMRSLMSQALDYTLPETEPVFGLSKSSFSLMTIPGEKYLVFLHGTTWPSKQWPESYWRDLVALANRAGYRVKIGGGNPEEVARAERIAKDQQMVDLVPYLSIANMAALLAHAAGAVAVDTGFGHLAGALDTPLVSIYGSTNPEYTGALGKYSICLAAKFPCAPCLKRECSYKLPSEVKPACYTTLPPPLVWKTLEEQLALVG